MWNLLNTRVMQVADPSLGGDGSPPIDQQMVPQGPAPGMTPPLNPGGVNLPYGGGTDPTTGPPSPAGTTPQTSTDPYWLTSMNNFLGSNVGQLAGGVAAGGLGLMYASQAQRNAQNLTNAISATARPGQNMSDATYRQLMGGPQMPGPYGQAVAGASSAANQLYGTAGRYASGNLTPAQQQQVAQNEAVQNAGFMTQMGGPGGMGLDSSAAAMMKQQNANNAALLTQQMQMNNIALANAALQGANTTYDALLGNALKQAGLGFDATSNAVKQQLAANQQVANAVQAILQSIVSGYSKASGNPQPQQPGGGGQGTGGGAVAQQGGGANPLLSMAGNMIGGAFANQYAASNAANIEASIQPQLQQAETDIASQPVAPLQLSDM